MNDITSPLRLATGSHKAGSGKGCAMNVVSWENGDTMITDYPPCTAWPLARLVQCVNDTCCAHRDGDLLCPPCSAVVLDLAHSVTGTAGATREQEAAWLAELLDSPEWGVIRFASEQGKTAVTRVANLLRRRAAGDKPAREDWEAARAAASTLNAAAYGVAVNALSAAYATYAVNAAYDAATSAAYDAAYVVNAAAYDAAYDAAYVVNAATSAVYAADAEARLVYARQAIAAWHRICGTLPAEVAPAVTASAAEKMLAKS